MPDVTWIGAFSAGLLSFLSPCILPMVPFYLSYMAGICTSGMDPNTKSDADWRRTVLSAILFSLGIITIFVALGASATFVGQAVREYFDLLRWLAAALLAMMGLHFLDVVKLSILDRQFTAQSSHAGQFSIVGSYVVGLAFAFGWTPCVGPILAAVLFVAAGQDTVVTGVILLAVYGLGMTLPFVICALFVQNFRSWVGRFRRVLPYIAKVNGILLLVFAFFIATNSMTAIANWMLENIVWFQGVG